MPMEAAIGDEIGDEEPDVTSLKLARLRLAVSLGRAVTQIEMARRIGVSRSKYAGLEAGSYQPSRELARKIAKVTDQTPGQVIDEYEKRRDA